MPRSSPAARSRSTRSCICWARAVACSSVGHDGRSTARRCFGATVTRAKSLPCFRTRRLARCAARPTAPRARARALNHHTPCRTQDRSTPGSSPMTTHPPITTSPRSDASTRSGPGCRRQSLASSSTSVATPAYAASRRVENDSWIRGVGPLDSPRCGRGRRRSGAMGRPSAHCGSPQARGAPACGPRRSWALDAFVGQNRGRRYPRPATSRNGDPAPVRASLRLSRRGVPARHRAAPSSRPRTSPAGGSPSTRPPRLAGSRWKRPTRAG